MSDPADTDGLVERIHELEAENAALTRQIAARPRARGGRWRAVVSAACILIATILVPASIVGAWARVQLVDEDAFVETLAPLIDEKAVQELIVDETMSAVRAQVDFRQLTDRVFDGVAGLGLDPRAVAALDLLRQPTADALASLVESTVTTVVESDAFSDVWESALRGAHRAVAVAADADGGDVFVLTRDGFGIAVGPLVEKVKATLTERGIGAAALIPAVDRTIILGDGSTLITIRAAYAIAVTIGWWLPVAALVLFGIGIAVARRRSVALIGAGTGLALGAAALGVVLAIASVAVAGVAIELDLSPSALDVIYARLVDDMRQTAWIFTLLGVFTALVGWLAGRSTAAVRIRSAIGEVNRAARQTLVRRGLDTRGFGSWLGRHRIAIRVAIGILAALWLFAMRPLTVGGIVLVILVALIVGWALEILQRRPEEHPTAETPVEQGAATEASAEDDTMPVPADSNGNMKR